MALFTAKEDEFMRKQKLCVIGTLQKDGYMHMAPIRCNFNGKNVYIPTHAKRKKIKNLKYNSKVSVMLGRYHNDQKQAEGVLVQGKAQVLKQGKEYLATGEAIGIKENGFDAKKKLYMYGPYVQYIIKVTPERKASWGVNHAYRGVVHYRKTGKID